MSQNDNEISDLFFRTINEPEPRTDSAESVSPAESPAQETPAESHYEKNVPNLYRLPQSLFYWQ